MLLYMSLLSEFTFRLVCTGEGSISCHCRAHTTPGQVSAQAYEGCIYMAAVLCKTPILDFICTESNSHGRTITKWTACIYIDSYGVLMAHKEQMNSIAHINSNHIGRNFRPGASLATIFFGKLFYLVKILSRWNFYTHRFLYVAAKQY